MNCNKTKDNLEKGKMDITRRPSLPATMGIAQEWWQHAASCDPRLFSSDTGGCLRLNKFSSRLSAFIRPVTSKELRRFAVAELGDALMPAVR